MRAPKETGYRHLFGPVPSRRLGRSLGVDLVPHKVCSLDCIYCECGATTQRTLQRRAWVEPDAVTDELTRWLSGAPEADYVTFSGAGEPTLHSGLGAIASWLAERTEIPQALLTNGTLLADPALRAELAPFSLICPSLDAVSEALFRRINRPHPSLTAAGLVDALTALRRDFAGQIWLEILLVEGVNDTDAELQRLSEAVAKIAPDRVQLNTAARPGTDTTVTAAPQRSLQRALERLGPIASPVAAFTEDRPAASQHRSPEALAEALLAVVRRRPETLRRLAASLAVDRVTLKRVADTLEADGRLRTEQRGADHYLIATDRLS